MATRAFIIHGYQSHPEEAWLPWLKRELERKGCIVSLPAMPHPDHPVIQEWIRFIAELIGEPDAETFIVGHSMGCQAVLHYLESVGYTGKSVGKTVLVAGSLPVQRSATEALKTAHGDPILVPWFSAGVDPVRIKHAVGECTVILSDNDPYLDVAAVTGTFRATLDPRIVSVPGAGHFNEDDHWMELPEALAALFPGGDSASRASQR